MKLLRIIFITLMCFWVQEQFSMFGRTASRASRFARQYTTQVGRGCINNKRAIAKTLGVVGLTGAGAAYSQKQPVRAEEESMDLVDLIHSKHFKFAQSRLKKIYEKDVNAAIMKDARALEEGTDDTRALEAVVDLIAYNASTYPEYPELFGEFFKELLEATRKSDNDKIARAFIKATLNRMQLKGLMYHNPDQYSKAALVILEKNPNSNTTREFMGLLKDEIENNEGLADKMLERGNADTRALFNALDINLSVVE